MYRPSKGFVISIVSILIILMLYLVETILENTLPSYRLYLYEHQAGRTTGNRIMRLMSCAPSSHVDKISTMLVNKDIDLDIALIIASELLKRGDKRYFPLLTNVALNLKCAEYNRRQAIRDLVLSENTNAINIVKQISNQTNNILSGEALLFISKYESGISSETNIPQVVRPR